MKRIANKFKVTCACAMALIWGSTSAPAAIYHVALTGNNGNNGSQQSPWRTIDYAADRVSPGDTVIVAAGNYNETVAPAVSGTSGSPITFYGGGVATNTHWSLSGRSHIRIVGFVVNRAGGADAMDLSRSDYIEVWDCRIQGSTRTQIMFDTGAETTTGNNCIISGNLFIGGTESRHMALRGANNLVEYNEFRGASEDYIYWWGQNNIIRNNYGHSPSAESIAHVDFLQTGSDVGGNDYTTIEANFYVDSDVVGDHHHLSNMSNSGGTPFTHCLLRRNIAHQIGTAVHNVFENWRNVYLVHENYLQSARHSSEDSTTIGVRIDNNARAFNCIAWHTWGVNVTSPRVWSFSSGGVHDYNLAFDPDGNVSFSGAFATETHSVRNQNPMFVNYGSDDFHLQSLSPAISRGGALTTVVSASGSGTTFAVGDAGFFRGDNPMLNQYGGNLVEGDTITVGTDVLKIASISGNNITVTTSFSWASGDPVFWGSDTTPDIGAYPYRAEGFDFGIDITSHSNGQLVSGTQTFIAAVNNPDVVRHVVFFVDGIPVGVDNQSPYTLLWNTAGLASGTQHTIEARACALYASKRLTESDRVTISVGAAGVRPAPPTNLRIISATAQ
jgi:hypothetical protein